MEKDQKNPTKATIGPNPSSWFKALLVLTFVTWWPSLDALTQGKIGASTATFRFLVALCGWFVLIQLARSIVFIAAASLIVNTEPETKEQSLSSGKAGEPNPGTLAAREAAAALNPTAMQQQDKRN